MSIGPVSRAVISLAALFSLVCERSLFAGSETRIKIEPGPRVMSKTEAALTPDPNAGSEHGIILVDETARIDFDTGTEISHHLRARIFSNEGRGLADIEIPFYTSFSDLRRWWGFAVLPDGRTMELPRKELKDAILARGGISNVSILKGAIPGVVPGSVIDYGYEVWDRLLRRSRTVPMQGRWPILDFKYRWRPGGLFSATLYADRTEALGIVTKQDLDSILITGHHIPAVLDEPLSPPDEELRGSLTTYYLLGPKEQKKFWDEAAKSFNRRAEDFAKKKLIRDAMAAMGLPAAVDLKSRLRFAYDWIGSHLTNLALRTSEEVEVAPDESDQRNARTVSDLMEAREGPGWQLDYLYMGVARELGAEACLVYTANRVDHYFHPEMLSVEQIGATLVAVRAPGEADDKRVLVDAGSGLPFGQIPWWTTGMTGLLATPDGAVDILVRPSEAVDNLSQSRVTIAFDVVEGTGTVHWTRLANGQSGLVDRRELRAMSPQQRVKRLDEYCGSSGDIEVGRAVAPGIELDAGPLKVDCDVTLTNTNLRAQPGEYQFSFHGPWIEAVPEFTSGIRFNPIVFPYARADRTTIDIDVPAGFNDRTVPSPVRLDTPYGRYMLDVTPTALGFHVERLFSLISLAVPPAEYAALRAYLSGVRRADQTMLAFRTTGDTP